jgi:hypothetical protein
MYKSLHLVFAFLAIIIGLLSLSESSTAAAGGGSSSQILNTPAAWPQTWYPVSNGSNQVFQDADDINGANSGYLDLYYSDAPHAATAAVAMENGTFYVRMQLQGSPGTSASLKNATWIVQIKNLSTGVVGAVVLDGKKGIVSVVKRSGSAAVDVVYRDQGASSAFHSAIAISPVWSQVVSPLVANSANNYYLDMQVPLAALNAGNTQLGIGATTPIQLFFGTSQASAHSGVINKDWMVGGTVNWNEPETVTLSTLGGGPLPVELTSFTAYHKDGQVSLHWRTETELNNLGFAVLCSSDAQHWEEIGFVLGAGTRNTPRLYQFTHSFPPRDSENLFYRLRQVDRDGSIDYSPTVMVHNLAANTVEITDAYPNPFNPATTVTFSLVQQERVSLSLIDVQGIEVRRLVDRVMMNAGVHAQTIQAADLPSGRYFVLLQTEADRHVYPVMLTK